MSSKITMFEGIMMVMISMFFDIVQFFGGLLDGAAISAWIINPFYIAPLQFWLFMKGIRNLNFLAGSAVGFIPFIGLLPVKTTAIIIVIILANNPKLAGVAAKLSKGPKTAPKAPTSGERKTLFSTTSSTHFNAS